MISCGDDGSPVLTVTSPDNGASYSPGDVIDISGTITDDVGLVSLRLLSPGFSIDEMETFSDNPLSQTFSFALTLDPNTELKEYDLTVTATDTDGNFDEEKITIEVK